jgi:putative phosphoesterase
MKIGIISDTHDDIENVRRAIGIFSKEEVLYVIHPGDYVFPGSVMEFKNLNARLIGVLGNNDGERGLLLKAFLEVRGELKGEVGELHINDLKVGIYHGTSAEIKKQLIESGRYNIIVCGHTLKKEPAGHVMGNYSNDTSTLVLNPGTGHRKTESLAGEFVEGGVIILDTQTREYRFIKLT